MTLCEHHARLAALADEHARSLVSAATAAVVYALSPAGGVPDEVRRAALRGAALRYAFAHQDLLAVVGTRFWLVPGCPDCDARGRV